MVANQLFKITKYTTFVCFCAYLLVSCEFKSSKLSSDNLSDYETPVTKPFKMPVAKPINWKVYPQDSVPVARTFPMNIDKLPSKPFSVNEFKPLPNPVKETPFDWNKLEKQPLNLDTIKGIPLKVKKFLLPKPLVTVASTPGIWERGNTAMVKLSQDEGLQGTQALAIIQDPQGITWIATEKGLSRYDGSEFLNYNFFTKSANGALEGIPELLFDKQGRLLVSGLESGIYRIDLKTGIVENFFYKDASPFRMTIDEQGRLWGTNNKLCFFDLDNKKVLNVNLKTDKNTPLISYGVKVDEHNNIWVGFQNKIGIIDASRKSIHFIKISPDDQRNIIFDFTPDNVGNIWLSTNNNLISYVSLKNKKIGSLGIEQGQYQGARDVFIDKKERVWLISNDTISLYDPKLARIKKIVTASKIINNFPSSGMKGNDGLMWVGTAADGILLIDPDGMLSDHFTVKDGLESPDFWGIQEDSKGRMWLSSYNGIHIYNPVTQRMSVLRFPAEVPLNRGSHLSKLSKDVFLLGGTGGFGIFDIPSGTMSFYDTRKGHIDNGSFTGFKALDGKIWFSGGKGANVFDPINKSIKKISKSNGLVSDLAFLINQDNKGRVWVMTENGANLIDPVKNTIYKFDKSTGVNSNYTSMFYQTSDGDIIIGGDKGISIFNNDLTTISQITAKNGMLPESLYDINEVNDRIHIGSENGIIIIEKPKKKGGKWHFYNYAKTAGFPLNDYNQSTSFVSSKGIAWWGAAPYLMVNHQDPVIDTLPPKVFIKGMNIMDQNVSFVKNGDLGASLSKQDTLWIGTKKYTKNTIPKDTGYLADNKIDWDDNTPGFNMPIGLKLSHDQNSFNFSFVNESQRERNNIVYRYFLDGVDTKWSESDTKNVSRIYYNLSPGDYTFNVISRGFNGVWSKPDQLKFTILSPWWQTWWAYLIYFVVFASLLRAYVVFRARNLKRENAILEEKIALRTNQLTKSIEDLKTTQSQLIQSEKMASLGELTAGIAHEIQNPLNFVNNFSDVSNELIQEIQEERNKKKEDRDETLVSEILDDIKQNLEKINFHGKRADGIVKGMLQHSRSSSSLKEPTDINKLADEYLRLAYHGLRAKDKSFNATLKTDFDESIGNVNVIPQDMGRAILNLITNAFFAVDDKKKSGVENYEPTVSVSTKKMVDMIQISVKDNANGIPQNVIDKIFHPFFTTKPTGQGTGLGLSLSYDIVNAHGGELKVTTVENEGSEFIILLPSK